MGRNDRGDSENSEFRDSCDLQIKDDSALPKLTKILKFPKFPTPAPSLHWQNCPIFSSISKCVVAKSLVLKS